MTFEQAFLKVKEKFDNADASKTADFAIQITFTDEDCGGTFYAQVNNGKLAVEPYDYYDNDTALNISKSVLLAVLAGRTSLDKAIANGDAVVHGDASKIADLKNTIKKAPAKKTAANKAQAKKTANKTAAAKKTSAKKPAAKKEETKAAPKTASAKTVAKKEETKAAPKAESKPAAKTVAPVKTASASNTTAKTTATKKNN